MTTFNVFVFDTIAISESLVFLIVETEECGVSFEEYKKAIGPLASTLSEPEIRHAYELSDRLAGVLFDMWRNESKKGVQ